MEGHCWRHTSCIDKVAARSLLISRLITALPMPRTNAALNILHQIERESSDPWQIESMRNGQECKLRRSNQRSWWMQGPGPEAIRWNTWPGILLLKLLRNSSVYGISMTRKLFLKKIVRALLYKSQPYVGEENFNFCIKVTLEQTFRAVDSFRS